MCSINGFTWRDEELARRMNKVTSHRGPDGTGVFASDSITLGHNRLSILDLSRAGAQPMKSSDGRFVISFNGEIYNYRELKRELSSYPFKSESDTEVILAAYTAWGDSAWRRLSGMFALALWDEKEKSLRLVRDPIGIKPLYYHLSGSRLIFASEIKAILQHPDVLHRIDPLALDCYLRVNYVPAPLTMFLGIKKLIPGQMLRYKDGKIELSQCTAKKTPELSRKPKKVLTRELRERVRESVKAQLVSDRPVGLYLSGGVDSSAVLEGMAAAKGRVETFSVGFELKEREQAEKFNADFLLARETAKHFGAIHHEVLVSPHEIIPLFEEAVYHLDEPVSNATIIPMLKLSRFAKSRVAVALEGDGGDELFGGYERYRLSLLSSYYRHLPRLMRKGGELFFPSLQKLNTAPGIERFAQFHFLKEARLHSLLQDADKRRYGDTQINADWSPAHDFFAERFFNQTEREIIKKGGLRGGGRATSGFFQQKKSVPFFDDFECIFLETDQRSWLVDESLLRSDKMSMASGLEARVPLLDLPLVGFADTIPLQHKVSLFRTKIILKEAFKDCLPRELLSQPKRGWFSPGAKWLRYPHIAAYAREVLSPDYAEATRTLFNWDEVRARLEGHINGEYHLTELWAILTLQIWAKRFRVTS